MRSISSKNERKILKNQKYKTNWIKKSENGKIQSDHCLIAFNPERSKSSYDSKSVRKNVMSAVLTFSKYKARLFNCHVLEP